MVKHLAAILAAHALFGATQADSLDVASKSIAATGGESGVSGELVFNSDATLAAFISSANNLVQGDVNGLHLDVFLKNLATGEFRLLTKGIDGAGAYGNSFGLTFTPDSKHLIFSSDAGNLVEGDPNQSSDLFKVELATGAIQRLTRNPDKSPRGAFNAQLSPDSQRLLFESDSALLVQSDVNAATDLFLLELATGEVKTVTKAHNFPRPAGGSMEPEINSAFSASGNFVIFELTASNVVSNIRPSGGPYQNVYLYDVAAGTNRVISVSTSGQTGNGDSGNATISPDERYVAFQTSASNLGGTSAGTIMVKDLTLPANTAATTVPPPSNVLGSHLEQLAFTPDSKKLIVQWNGQIYLYDLVAKIYTVVTAKDGGTIATGSSELIGLTPDGTSLFFSSVANDLKGITETNGFWQAYTYNLESGQIQLRSRTTDGLLETDFDFPILSPNGALLGFNIITDDGYEIATMPFGEGSQPLQILTQPRVATATGDGFSGISHSSMDAGGSKVLFWSNAGDLVPGDENEMRDNFLFDTAGKTNSLVNATAAGVPSERGTGEARLSRDGRFVVFSSLSNDLGPEDTNNVSDIYLKDLATGQIKRISTPRADSTGPDSGSSAPQISADGKVIVYNTFSTNIAPDGRAGMIVHFVDDGSSRYFAMGSESTGILMPNGEAFIGPRTMRYPLLKEGTITGTTLVSSASLNDSASGFNSNSFTYSTTAELGIYNLAASQRQVITNRALSSALSWDGTVLAVERYSAASGPIHLELVNTATREFRMIHDLGARGVNGMALSENGRRLVFSTHISLTAGDTNDLTDVYLYDSVSDSTLLLSRAGEGRSGNHASTSPVISADGRVIAFSSAASDLVAGDLNNAVDVFVYQVTTVDTDEDGLDDAWEISWFGNLEQNRSGDFDNDGMSNSAEYQAGTNPASNESVLVVTRITNLKTGGISLLWSSVSGKRYQVQYKDDLTQPWQNLGQPYTAAQGNTEAIDQSGAPATPPSRFYRVIVLQ